MLRATHTAQTQTNGQLPLSNHSVVSRLTRWALLLNIGWRWSLGASPPLPNIALIRMLCASNTEPVRVANGSDPQTANDLRHCKLNRTRHQSMWFQKLPTQLNTPNRFVPELVRVSPNVSGGQQLDRFCSTLYPSISSNGYLLPSIKVHTL